MVEAGKANEKDGMNHKNYVHSIKLNWIQYCNWHDEIIFQDQPWKGLPLYAPKAIATTEMDQNILNRFEGEQGLIDVLFKIGISANERDRIVDDGITSMKELVKQYENDPEGLKDNMKRLK